jgi:hypothetical protein
MLVSNGKKISFVCYLLFLSLITSNEFGCQIIKKKYILIRQYNFQHNTFMTLLNGVYGTDKATVKREMK